MIGPKTHLSTAKGEIGPNPIQYNKGLSWWPFSFYIRHQVVIAFLFCNALPTIMVVEWKILPGEGSVSFLSFVPGFLYKSWCLFVLGLCWNLMKSSLWTRESPHLYNCENLSFYNFVWFLVYCKYKLSFGIRAPKPIPWEERPGKQQPWRRWRNRWGWCKFNSNHMGLKSRGWEQGLTISSKVKARQTRDRMRCKQPWTRFWRNWMSWLEHQEEETKPLTIHQAIQHPQVHRWTKIRDRQAQWSSVQGQATRIQAEEEHRADSEETVLFLALSSKQTTTRGVEDTSSNTGRLTCHNLMEQIQTDGFFKRSVTLPFTNCWMKKR